MNLSILTTDTLHHCYYISQLLQKNFNVSVVAETTSVYAPFNIAHPFEHTRDEIEKTNWFDGKSVTLNDFITTTYVDNINNSIEIVKSQCPDIIIIFGTRKISPAIINICGKNRTWNLHGGNPESYRGLDSHLWAIYHKEFHELQTCLHKVTPELDDGNIIAIEKLRTPTQKELSQKLTSHNPEHILGYLRTINTELCVDLTIKSLKKIQTDITQIEYISQKLAPNAQQKIGRYYSFMPTDLKSICVKNYRNFIYAI